MCGGDEDVEDVEERECVCVCHNTLWLFECGCVHMG